MRLEDLDYDALIRQMWGSEENLDAYLESEVPQLCFWICGPEVSSPAVKVTYSPLRGKLHDGVPMEAVANVLYQPGCDGTQATIFIPAVIAGYREKLPRVIARELVHHWEALGAIGGDAFDYPESVDELLTKRLTDISEEGFRERYSPRYIAKAIKVAQILEVNLEEFLFPKITLRVYMPESEESAGESS